MSVSHTSFSLPRACDTILPLPVSISLPVPLFYFLSQSPSRLYACLLIAAFCLQDQIIVTAVECSLRGGRFRVRQCVSLDAIRRAELRTAVHKGSHSSL